jgi:hypothetical protein
MGPSSKPREQLEQSMNFTLKTDDIWIFKWTGWKSVPARTAASGITHGMMGELLDLLAWRRGRDSSDVKACFPSFSCQLFEPKT